MAGLSEAILAEGTLTADLNSSSSAQVTLETIATDAADGDEATGDVNSDLLFGVYTVAENENVTGLSIEEFTQWCEGHLWQHDDNSDSSADKAILMIIAALILMQLPQQTRLLVHLTTQKQV